MKVKTLSAELNHADAVLTVRFLMNDSRWFEVTPMPDDLYHIKVKDEYPVQLRFPEGTVFDSRLTDFE